MKTAYFIITINVLLFSALIVKNIDFKTYDEKQITFKALKTINHNPSSMKKFKKTILVGMIDTGVDQDHDFLKFNLSHVNQKDNEDFIGHGTHVAGIIKAVNPSVRIASYKYTTGKERKGTKANSRKALRKAIDRGVNIISYSGGGRSYDYKEYKLLEKAQKKGILVVVAAGNYGDELKLNNNHCNYFPACYSLDNLIVVGALDSNAHLNEDSNYGKKVDVVAPGTDILSTLPNNKIGYLSGTSMATPFVTGLASILMAQNPNYNYKKIKQLIIESTIDSRQVFNCHEFCPPIYSHKIITASPMIYKNNNILSLR